MDIAFSGNGEPTSAAEFPAAVEMVGRVLAELGLPAGLKLRLITNGSLLHWPAVQAGIAMLGALGGEVWFKLDRGTAAGMLAVNKTAMEPAKVLANLLLCAGLAPTWVQTCWFALDGTAPSDVSQSAYCDLLRPFAGKLSGVHLYGLARPSLQPAASHLSALPADVYPPFARRIEKETGIPVIVSP